MNLRKLLTFTGAATLAVMPVATAQNPTILQGSYVSNVFGQSNFVKNPNAQTNTANVTLTTATATRSTTTPLVATSEYNVTITSANGTVAWDTRSFDAGMKNQNCEARFTYRGFQATSKAQIKQGANVVAELVLTPSATDPRIASINFPCGDLSSATTFVITDTATLAGTNEIGGIYVGLATNQANIAQAETVVIANVNALVTIPPAAYTDVPYQSESLDVYGEYDSTTGVFTAKRAGNYFLSASIFWVNSAWGASNIYINVFKNSGLIVENLKQISAGTKYYVQESSVGITLAVGDTLRVAAYQSDTANRFIASNSSFSRLSISRFPSSSELVVTPETQNWYVNAVQAESSSYPFLGLSTVAAWTEIQAGSGAMTPESGSQPVAALCASGTSPAPLSTSTTNCGGVPESLGIAFAIPTAGQYEVCAEWTHAINGNANSALDVYFRLAETNLSNTTILQGYTAGNNGGIIVSSNYGEQRQLSQCRIFTFASVGTKAVRLMYNQTVSGTITGNVIPIDSNLSRGLRWTIQPVNNKSNSALYVQGPVKASATGTAIPAGYVGEKLEAIQSSIVNVSSATMNTPSTITTLSNVPPGVWNLCFSAFGYYNQTTSSSFGAYEFSVVDSALNVILSSLHLPGTYGQTTHYGASGTGQACKTINLTSTETFTLRQQIRQWTGGLATGLSMAARCSFLTSRCFIQATRIN